MMEPRAGYMETPHELKPGLDRSKLGQLLLTGSGQ